MDDGRSKYAGPVKCLRCDSTFESADRRTNRICPRCKNAGDRSHGVRCVSVAQVMGAARSRN